MGFHHVVLFRWIDTVTDEQIRAVTRALDELPDAIPGLERFRYGADADLAQGNWDFAVVADFADEAAYLVYRDHPAHRTAIAKHIAPLLAERVAVQFPSGQPSG